MLESTTAVAVTMLGTPYYMSPEAGWWMVVVAHELWLARMWGQKRCEEDLASCS